MLANEPAKRKSVDLEDVRPVALDGGTAILERTYRTTSFGTEIDTGEVPVATKAVAYAERQAGNAEVLA